LVVRFLALSRINLTSNAARAAARHKARSKAARRPQGPPAARSGGLAQTCCRRAARTLVKASPAVVGHTAPWRVRAPLPLVVRFLALSRINLTSNAARAAAREAPAVENGAAT
jgi:hypothetical protein